MSIGLNGFWKEHKENNLKCKLYELKLELKYAWQRAYKGYDSRDIWAFDCMFKERTIEILKRYKETRNCLWWCPDGYELGKYDENYNRYILTSNQMDSIIDTLIFHLQMSDEDFCEKQLYGLNVFDDEYKIGCRTTDEYIKIEKVRKQNQDAAMKLLTLFMDDLWD